MEYQNTTSRFLKEAFPIPSFDAFVNQRLEEIIKPVPCPCYALEAEKAHIAQLNEFISKNPYGQFEFFTVNANRLFESVDSEMITALSDPMYFDCLRTCCDALGFGNMAGYVYGNPDGVWEYNAMATGYLDMGWVLVSKPLRMNNLINDLDLAFLVGHELGHLAAMHSSITRTCKLTPEEDRDQEYTADRAGLLAVLWRVEMQNPGCEPKALYAKALESCIQTFRKLHILLNVRNDGPYTEQTLKLKLSDPKCAIPVRESRRKDSHPTDHERVQALTQYIKTMDFAECIHTLWGSEHGAAIKF